eukprot:CAMPEP_0116004108 /NCGR_PEP_ID=MMETSP0321-20121206/418_1 /TAXON_ID=163516 /ORGANISM="Leptocylindrus danicus var. danicus, Strain B650" /LENGTH=135 /DNA_ID=CAMNT_0003472371 /DNA_START=339 /DNA_END=746 /DNA_ORIENTATION=-
MNSFDFHSGAPVGVILGWRFDKQSPLGRLIYPLGMFDMVVNKEGSISPKYAPHLALGVLIVGEANEMISSDQLNIAVREAKRRTDPLILFMTDTICPLLFIVLRYLKRISFFRMVDYPPSGADMERVDKAISLDL